jgi:hypothetical protein
VRYTTAIDAARDAIKQSALGTISNLLEDFAKIDWNELPEAVSHTDAQVNCNKETAINLYPSLAKKAPNEQAYSILREYGTSFYHRAGGRAKTYWDYKLCLPDQGQVGSVQGKLQSVDFGTYREMVESFTTCLDRHVALNICNALLKAGVSRDQARNLNIAQYGCTADYSNLRRCHSILPYVTAYAPRDLGASPGLALAELLMNDLRLVSESSVAAGLKKVVLAVYRTAPPV